MTLVKVNKQNGSNENTPSVYNRPSIFGEPGSLINMFESFTNPFWRRNLLDDFFDDNMNLTRSSIGTTVPAVNIEETDTDLIINVAAPGMNKKDFKVEINDNQLHIGYKKETQTVNNGSNQWRKEYNFEAFERNFTLPAIVESDKIQATYTDGILKIVVPKKEEARRKPAKAIEIK